MSAITAAVSKQSANAVPLVIAMLEELGHRGTGTIQVAAYNSMVTAKSFHEIRNKNIVSATAVGIALSKEHLSSLNVVLKKDYALAFQGHLFPPSKPSDAEEVAGNLEPEAHKKAATIIKRFDGSYTFAVALQKKIIAGRDLSGTAPLYFGQNESFCAVASERKALWKIGISHAESFPRGSIAALTPKGFKLKPAATVKQPVPRRRSLEAAHHLHELLLDSTIERVADTETVAVAFSGGLDSSVVAVLAKECNKKVELITVGLEGQSELEHAENAAKVLELPIHVQAFTVADVKKVLKWVLWLIEEPDVMKAGVAVPFFWAAQTASKIGCHVLLAGQGADELFGGHHKYLRAYASGGAEALQKAMFDDVVNSYENNFQRDNPVCAFHKVELRLPFIDREVMQFALRLPVNLKITSAEDNIRKHVLRRVAQNMKIPAFVSDKTKKAVQYTTGVDRAIRELAREKGLSQKDYIQEIFDEVYPALKGKKEK